MVQVFCDQAASVNAPAATRDTCPGRPSASRILTGGGPVVTKVVKLWWSGAPNASSRCTARTTTAVSSGIVTGTGASGPACQGVYGIRREPEAYVFRSPSEFQP